MSSPLPTIERAHSVAIAIGGITVRVRTTDPAFVDMLRARYAGFTAASEPVDYELDVELIPTGGPVSADSDLNVRRNGRLWELERGDFRATWDLDSRRGLIRQSANPYSLDSVLRIVHTLALAERGGFLLHAASAIRHGRAFLFSGVSGVGKTTMTRLAPADATLLTDEISYVRLDDGGYEAYGTPFAGELAKVGENVKAPIAGIYLLTQGPEHRIDEIPRAEALRALMRNVLFFAEDAELVRRIFHAACALVDRVPVRRLTFLPDAGVWELIR
jgi:hypothetical protein